MTYVVTFITNPAQFRLETNLMGTIEKAVTPYIRPIGDLHWLAEEEACDLFFDADDIHQLKAECDALCENIPLDYFIQIAGHRKKQLLISDMDSTMIEQECIDELADYMGIKTQIAEITDRAMNGELDFAQSLRERVKLLQGLSEEILQQAFEEKVTFTPGAKALVQTMVTNGATCILVSGGFTFFARHVAKELGFQHYFANELEIKDSVLTGNVIEPILDKDSKRQTLLDHTNQHNIDLNNTLAIGDGANDLPMLQTAGLGVAYKAKPTVRAQTNAHIEHTTLLSLLYAQGYTKEGIIGA